MRCPNCRETINDSARLCRYCQSPIETSYRNAAARENLIRGLVICGVSLTLMIKCFGGSREPAREQIATQIDSAEAAARLTKCQSLMADAERLGLVREVREQRIVVDPALWSRFPAGSKLGLLAALVCINRSGREPETLDAAFAYDYYSGKRLTSYVPNGGGLRSE